MLQPPFAVFQDARICVILFDCVIFFDVREGNNYMEDAFYCMLQIKSFCTLYTVFKSLY